MGIAHDAAKSFGRAIGNVNAGVDKLVSRKLAAAMTPRIPVTSTAFAHEGTLPISATVEGSGVPPVLEWSDIPAQTKSIAVVCEDPDAPMPEPFVHWLVHGLPPSAEVLDRQALADAREGKNSRMTIGFAPAAPPPGHGVHHYHFQVFALDVPTSKLEEAIGRGALADAMSGHVVAWGEVVGTYERS